MSSPGKWTPASQKRKGLAFSFSQLLVISWVAIEISHEPLRVVQRTPIYWMLMTPPRSARSMNALNSVQARIAVNAVWPLQMSD